MKKIAIIGGGITGLSAAFYLKKWASQHPDKAIDIKVFEATEKCGGKLQTVRQDGFIMERGADSFLKRKTAAMTLIKDLQLESQIIENSTGQAYIATSRGLKAIPQGTYMGMPVFEADFLECDLLSEAGKARALREVDLPRKVVQGDQALGHFLRRRFGDEMVDELLAPLLSGIYSSDVDDMSLQATFPQFYEYEQTYGSVLKGLRDKMPKQRDKKSAQFASLKGGLSTLVEALTDQLADHILPNQTIQQIVPNDGHYILSNQAGDDYEADYVFAAIPFDVFKGLWREASYLDELSVPNRSVGNFVLQFDSSDWQNKIEGTGFVVAKSSGLPITACTWVNQKWPQAVLNDDILLRLYVGRASEADILNQDEASLKRLVLESLEKTMGIHVQPRRVLFTKWIKKMPQYRLNHQAKVHDIRLALAENLPGIFIGGASYDGVGIPDCIQSAKEMVGQVTEIV